MFTGAQGSAPIQIRCGRCTGCRLTRAQDWSTRISAEARLHQVSSFVTLTYDTDNCPVSLRHSDFQSFMRRLRKWLKRHGYGRVRFFMCGEYGELGDRPHYHAVLFGVRFPDLKVHKTCHSSSGPFIQYRSAVLEMLWPHGFSTVSDYTSECGSYVSHYVVKKISGDFADSHYRRVDPATGSEVVVEREYARMSLRHGIGTPFLGLYAPEVFDSGHMVTKGRRVPIPRRFVADLKSVSPDGYEALIERRKVFANALFNPDEERRSRLDATENVLLARLKTKRGSL